MRQLENQKFYEYLVQVKAQAKKCEIWWVGRFIGERHDSAKQQEPTMSESGCLPRKTYTHEQVQEKNAESRDEAAVAPMDANGRKFGQGQMDQRRMAKPQNTKQQHQTTREDQRILL
jgi:hypothetical protein